MHSHFHLRTQEVLVSSGAEILAFVPVVEPSQEAAWEAYAAEHQDWLGESFVESGRHDLDPGNMPTSIQTIGDRGFVICPLWQVVTRFQQVWHWIAYTRFE